MALDIKTLRQQAEGPMYTAPETICLTASGEITDELDPAAVKLLVRKGGQITTREAETYGLIGAVPAAAVPAPAPDDDEEKPKVAKRK